MSVAAAVLALTETPWLVAFVDQTQITKPARWPALTSPTAESDWIRTQSWAVAFLGFGADELGVGLGEVELGFGDGVDESELSEGDGLVVVAGDDVLAADEDGGAELDVLALDVLGLDDGLALDALTDAEELADDDELADLLGDRDGCADLSRDADELAKSAPGVPVAGFVTAAESTVLFGTSGHAADWMIEWLLASAAWSSLNVLQPIRTKPASAPSAAGLRSSALTCASSCAFSHRSDCRAVRRAPRRWPS
jgi:hypothetical protein